MTVAAGRMGCTLGMDIFYLSYEAAKATGNQPARTPPKLAETPANSYGLCC